MYSRLFNPPEDKSYFLFGPRGTGKTTWVRTHYPSATYLDLLDFSVYTDLFANPGRLAGYVEGKRSNRIIIDEVQRVPELLNEVHRLIEEKRYLFVLTGSSARKLRRGGHNLLGGRAHTYFMHPLTALEMGDDFDVLSACIRGMLPLAQDEGYEQFLKGYIRAYLEQEVQQEGFTRNLSAFSRFLEVASFSQGQILNISNVASEAAIGRKTVEGYFGILRDLLIGYFLPPFTKRAKRRLVTHPKFYFFDPGVYRAIRPMGPYDLPQEIGGISLETLIFQQLYAVNDLMDVGYRTYYFRTATGVEVDFVLYGPRGIIAFEVKRSSTFRSEMIAPLLNFARDYPEAKLYLLYGGKRVMHVSGVTVLPIRQACIDLGKLLA